MSQASRASAAPADENTQVDTLVKVCRKSPKLVEDVCNRLANQQTVTARGVTFSLSAMYQAIHRVDPDAEVLIAFPHLSGSTASDNAPGPSGSGGSSSSAVAIVPVDPEDAPMPPAPELEPPQLEYVVADVLVQYKPEENFELVKLAQYVELVSNFMKNYWEVVNRLTMETFVLPDSMCGWLLHKEDDGEAIVVEQIENAEPRTYDVAEIFKLKVYRSLEDDRHQVRRKVGAWEDRVWLSEHRAANHAVSVEVFSGDGNSAQSLRGTVFDVHRDCCRFYFDAESVASSLKIKRVGKTTGEYVCHQWHSFRKIGQRYQMLGVLGSMPYEFLDVGVEVIEDRVLPWKALSAEMILLLLSIWGFCQKQSHGLVNMDEKRAATSMLSRMLRTFEGQGALSIPLVATENCRRAVTGCPVGGPLAYIIIDEEQNVDFTGLDDLRFASAVARKWLGVLERRFPGNPPSLMEFIRFLVCDMVTREWQRNFTQQIFWSLGALFDDKLVRILAVPDPLLSWVSVVERVPIQKETSLVALYVQSAQDLIRCEGAQFLSCSVDKSRVASYGMLCGAYVLPSGNTFWGPPQDRPRGHVVLFFFMRSEPDRPRAL